MENNGENSGPLSSLPVDRLTATDYNPEHQFFTTLTARKFDLFMYMYNPVIFRAIRTVPVNIELLTGT